MNIAVLCPSEIALRRFMPALHVTDAFTFVGIGVASPSEWFGCRLAEVPAEAVADQQRREYSKAEVFVSRFGGRVFNSYSELLEDDEVEAVYVPLPPGLHFQWARAALAAGKHLLVEKPAAISFEESAELIKIATENE